MRARRDLWDTSPSTRVVQKPAPPGRYGERQQATLTYYACNSAVV